MSRILKEARIEHTFGGEEPSGWLPSTASTPARTPEHRVTLRLTLEVTDGGYILQWEGPALEYSGDNWYAELEYAEEAATELFGVKPEDWVSSA